jgi:catechol 2,3-dioxygenase-like lactoylglutathione lyase family enzyme
MEFHRGRLVDHVQLRVADLKRARDFYVAVLGTLGLSLEIDTAEAFGCDELYVSPAGNDATSAVHLAFQADSPETVRRFHRAALEHGGSDNGAPGERDYHPGYYAAFVRDPDGNNIEAVHHGPSTRSAASVVIRPA